MLCSQTPSHGCKSLVGGYGQFEIEMGDCDWWREGGAVTEGFVDRNLSECHRSDVVHRVRCCCHGDPGDSWVGRWGLDSLKSGDTLGLHASGKTRSVTGPWSGVRCDRVEKRGMMGVRRGARKATPNC